MNIKLRVIKCNHHFKRACHHQLSQLLQKDAHKINQTISCLIGIVFLVPQLVSFLHLDVDSIAFFQRFNQRLRGVRRMDVLPSASHFVVVDENAQLKMSTGMRKTTVENEQISAGNGSGEDARCRIHRVANVLYGFAE